MPKKAYSKTGQSCRVTFTVPAVADAGTVALCGEFNDWDPTTHLLTRRKSGYYSVTVSLPSGRQYRYRYLLDGEHWENDHEADGYAPNPYGSEDCLVDL